MITFLVRVKRKNRQPYQDDPHTQHNEPLIRYCNELTLHACLRNAMLDLDALVHSLHLKLPASFHTDDLTICFDV